MFLLVQLRENVSFTGSTTTTNDLSNVVFVLYTTGDATTAVSVHCLFLWLRQIQLAEVRSSVHGARQHITLQTADEQLC